jgi:hypothetical protein
MLQGEGLVSISNGAFQFPGTQKRGFHTAWRSSQPLQQCRLQLSTIGWPSICAEHKKVQRLRLHAGISGCFAGPGRPGRPRNVTFFIDEIKKLVIPLYGMRNQHLRFAIARLGFGTNIPFAINEIQVFFVVSFQAQLLYLLCHTCWTVKVPVRMPA